MSTARTAANLTEVFFQQMTNPIALADLFELLPETYLFVKDKDHRFVKVNQSLARLFNCKTVADMIGRTDFDFSPPALAAQFVEEDRRVMDTGQPLLNQVWIVQSGDGVPKWYLSSKVPVLGPKGVAIGVAGVMWHYVQAGIAPGDYQRLTTACNYVQKNYGRRITAGELAKSANLSRSQLQREFRRLFSMSPGDYILRVRLLMARRQLESTTTPIGRVALECGFYDQSHFTRAFRVATGLRPLEYRRRFTPKLGWLNAALREAT